MSYNVFTINGLNLIRLGKDNNYKYQYGESLQKYVYTTLSDLISRSCIKIL